MQSSQPGKNYFQPVATRTINRIKFAQIQIAMKRCSLSATSPLPRLLKYLSVLLFTPSILFSFSSSTINFSFCFLSSRADAIAMFSVSTSFPCILSTASFDFAYKSKPVSTTFLSGADSKSNSSVEGFTRYCLRLSSQSSS